MPKTRTDVLRQFSGSDLRLIRVYKAVVENGGFSAAAPVLGISGSAVSIHMARLEARLGMRLCQRGRTGFALTPEGQKVYEASQHMLSAVENFRTEVNGLHNELRGELNIGITDNLVTFPRMNVTNALTALKLEGPGIHINIQMGPPADIERGVIDGRFHAGVVPAINRLAALAYTHLYEEASCLYCASSHPLFSQKDATITARELARHDAVRPSFPLTSEGLGRQRALHDAATASDREGMVFLILTGRYIGYLPRHFAARWVGSGQLRAIQPDRQRYLIPYAIITRHGRVPNRVLNRFMRLIDTAGKS